MQQTTIKYWIEVDENGTPKIVPHDGKKNYMFLIRKTAETFKKKLKKANPNNKFRLVVCKVTNNYCNWE